MLCQISPRQQGRWAAMLMIVVAIVAVALGAEAQQQKASADTTESSIDDILVPLVGKILRGVILLRGGIIIRPTTGIF